jgi:hypothetical protein
MAGSANQPALADAAVIFAAGWLCLPKSGGGSRDFGEQHVSRIGWINAFGPVLSCMAQVLLRRVEFGDAVDGAAWLRRQLERQL